MDADEPRTKADATLAALIVQDLTPLSIAELDARIAALNGEIARVAVHRENVVNHRASADAIFRR